MTGITPYSTIVIEPNTNNYNYIASKHLFKVITNTNSILTSTKLNDIIYNNDKNYIDALTITTNGIGIGNTNPKYYLDVSNTAYFNYLIGNGHGINNVKSENIRTDSNRINIERFGSFTYIPGLYGSESNAIAFTIDNYGRIISINEKEILLRSNAIVGLSASATIDTTNAANINYGLLSTQILPSSINITNLNIFNGYNFDNINASNISTGKINVSVMNISGVVSGSYGNSINTYIFNIDSYGRITSITNVRSITPINASNITTGTLSASRLPTINNIQGSYGSIINNVALTIDNYGRIISIQNNSSISKFSYEKISGLSTSATIDTTNASNITTGILSTSLINSFTSLYLTGDGSGISNINVALANTEILLSPSQYPPSGVIPGVYGSTTNTLNFVIDRYGRILSVSNTNYISNSITNISFTNTFSSSLFPSTLTNYSISNSNATSTARGYNNITNIASTIIQTTSYSGSILNTNRFGYVTANSFNGDIYVVGSQYIGSIFIYKLSTGVLLKSYSLGNNFGAAIDISNDGTLIVVTSTGDQRLYLIKYKDGAWPVSPLLVCDGNASLSNTTIPFGLGFSQNILFGNSVCIIDNAPTNYIILVGTYSSTIVGRVYQFGTLDTSGDTWVTYSSFTSSNSHINDCFGYSLYSARWIQNSELSVYGIYGYTVISAINSNNTGAVYIYYNTISNGILNAIELKKIIGSDILTNDNYGKSVTSIMYDNNICYIAIGVPNKDQNKGQVYVYYSKDKFETKTELILRAFDGVSGDLFGQSIQLINYDYNNYNNKRSLIVGAPGANNNGGKIYIYTIDKNLNTIPAIYYDFTYLQNSVSNQQIGWCISKPSLLNKIIIGSPAYNYNGGNSQFIGGLVYISQLRLYDSSNFITQLSVDNYGRIINTSVILPPFPSTIIKDLGDTSITNMNTINILGSTVNSNITIGNVKLLYDTTINGSTINLGSTNILINNKYGLPKYVTGKFISSSIGVIPLLNFNLCVIRLNINLGSIVSIGGVTISGTNSTSEIISVSNAQERYLLYDNNGSVLNTSTGKIFDINNSINLSENYFTEIKIINNGSGNYYYMTKTVYRRTNPNGTTKVSTSGYLNATTSLINLRLICTTGTITGTWTAIYD